MPGLWDSHTISVVATDSLGWGQELPSKDSVYMTQGHHSVQEGPWMPLTRAGTFTAHWIPTCCPGHGQTPVPVAQTALGWCLKGLGVRSTLPHALSASEVLGLCVFFGFVPCVLLGSQVRSAHGNSLRSGGRASPLHRWPHFFCCSYFLPSGSSEKWSSPPPLIGVPHLESSMCQSSTPNEEGAFSLVLVLRAFQGGSSLYGEIVFQLRKPR